MAFPDLMRKQLERWQHKGAQEKGGHEKPETAKEMYTRKDAEQKANARPVEGQISESHKAQALEVGKRIDAATKHMGQGRATQPAAPSDGAGSQQPMRQNAMNQDKSAPALSPTSAQKGTPATEKGTPSQEPAKQPEKAAPQRPQTMARPQPSWQR